MFGPFWSPFYKRCGKGQKTLLLENDNLLSFLNPPFALVFESPQTVNLTGVYEVNPATPRYKPCVKLGAYALRDAVVPNPASGRLSFLVSNESRQIRARPLHRDCEHLDLPTPLWSREHLSVDRFGRRRVNPVRSNATVLPWTAVIMARNSHE